MKVQSEEMRRYQKNLHDQGAVLLASKELL